MKRRSSMDSTLMNPTKPRTTNFECCKAARESAIPFNYARKSTLTTNQISRSTSWPWNFTFYQLAMELHILPAGHGTSHSTSWPWNFTFYQLVVRLHILPAGCETSHSTSWL
ncbi:hypothetical protein BsWGS_11522 [Bradybaena similaris]